MPQTHRPAKKPVTRRPAFWALLTLASAGASFFAYRFYPKAFPVVPLDIRMNRTEAMSASAALATSRGWLPHEFRQAAEFDSDDRVQTYVELGAGGTDAFVAMLRDQLYSPYTWQVRQFHEGDAHESLVRFTPKGQPYGFRVTLPESERGPALEPERARAIGEAAAHADWGIDFSDFKLVEVSRDAKTGGRVDHTFVYERPNARIGDGRFRLRLVVAGDRLTEVTHYIQIPEAFSRRYAQMRSTNDTIANMSTVAMVILYLLGGCGAGLFFLGRARWVVWKPAVALAAVVAALTALENINRLPLLWMSYDTALSSRAFLATIAANSGVTFLAEFLLLAASFMAAESLSRRAFPRHPQLWRALRRDAAASDAIGGRVLGGYLAVGLFHAFVVALYYFGKTRLGWWNPADTLFHPDALATYLPWLTAIATSAHAGLWEECLFRAVPLAAAALLGNRLGHRKKWIAGAFVLQIAVFASAHANYLAQPAYARVVELVLPSAGFGALYLAFGLIPGMILHFCFDTVAFALPLFAASTPGIWVDRAAVVALAGAPLIWVLAARFSVAGVRRALRSISLRTEFLNQSWKPMAAATPPAKSHAAGKGEPSAKSRAGQGQKSDAPLARAGWAMAAAAALALLSLRPLGQRLKPDAPRVTVGRSQAVRAARDALAASGVRLSPDWHPLARLQAADSVEGDSDYDYRLVWRDSGPDAFRSMMGSYLAPPGWKIRFARFDSGNSADSTDVAERAEEYRAFVAGDGSVYRMRHILPEARPGAALPREKARLIAQDVLKRIYGLELDDVDEVSSEDTQQPHRVDWLFIFTDHTRHVAEGEARIAVRVSGDQATASRRYIFVPDEWARHERDADSVRAIVSLISWAALVMLMAAAAIAALIAWSKREFDSKGFWVTFAILGAVKLASLLNGIPRAMAGFATSQSFTDQMLTTLAFGAMGALTASATVALVLGYVMGAGPSAARRANPAEPDAGFSGVSLAAISLGVLVASAFAALHVRFGAQMPTWPDLSGGDSYVPWLGFLDAVGGFAARAALVTASLKFADKLSLGWSRRRVATSAFILFVGFVFAGPLATIGLSLWVAAGAVIGLALLVGYRGLARAHVERAALAVAGAVAFQQVRLFLDGAFPGARAAAFFSILVIFAAANAWYIRATPAQELGRG